MEYGAVYKCRLCGKISVHQKTGKTIAEKEMLLMISNNLPHEINAPSALNICYCQNGNMGLADLQGWKKIDK